MGQYHYVANYDKRQYLDAHKFGEGIKLMEFGCGSQGLMTALAVLLAASCQGGARGGGDIHPWTGGPGYEGRCVPGLTQGRGKWLMENVVGLWAGDRIAIIGDYCQPEDAGGLVEREGSPWDNLDNPEVAAKRANTNLKPWVDISALAREAIEMDYYVWSDRHKKEAAA